MTVFSVVQQTNSITRLAEVDPAVSRSLKSGHIPWGVSVVGARHGAESSFRPHFVRLDTDRKERAQEPPSPAPMYTVMNLQDPGKPSEAVSLDYLDTIMPASDPQSGTQWAVFDQLRCAVGKEFHPLIAIRSIDIPGIELTRNVRE